MDAYTLKHLDAWLDRHTRAEEAEELKAKMLDVVLDDPSLLDQGWSRVRDIAVGR